MASSQRVNFEDLKARTSGRLADVLAHYGIQIIGSGEQAKIHCPFGAHEDKRPSCSVNLERGLFHCFVGSCPGAKGGNVLDFVWRMENRNGQTVTLRQAGLKLAEICDIQLAETGGQEGARRPADGPPHHGAKAGPSTLHPEKAPQSAVEARTELGTAGTGKTMGEGLTARPGAVSGASGDAGREARKPNRPLRASFVTRFQSSLDRTHPYLAERSISPELADTFGIGYAPEGANSMGGRLCLPIHSATGEIVAFAGRWAGEPPEGVEKWLLPKGFHKALEFFNLHRVRHCRHLVIVEGFLDAVRLFGLRPRGIPAVALMGTSLSDQQVELLRAHCTALKAITVLLDADPPGRTAAPLVAAKLAAHWWVHIAALPDGLEPATADESLLRALVKGEMALAA